MSKAPTVRPNRGEPRVSPALLDHVRALARPLKTPADLDPLMELIGGARCVLLGEASHGTAEYYTWRTAISRRLIEEKGFSFIAVEGDWPDCDRVDRFVKGKEGAADSPRDALHAFERWPSWMWANQQVAELVDWLRRRNDDHPPASKVGFHGLDVYSLWDSLYAVMGFLRRTDPTLLPTAWQAFRCFEPYGEDVREYAQASRFIPNSCEDEVVALLKELQGDVQRGRSRPESTGDPDDRFDAEQNALVLQNAEAYYRAMIRGGADSWNLRDRHMADTLDRLMDRYGPRSRAIVWAHNSHIGDARFTDMAGKGMINVGQLARERRGGADVVLVGFGSHRGSVIAGDHWEGLAERTDVPPARVGSWEDVLHRAEPKDGLFLLTTSRSTDALLEPRGHRAIGVVYHPQYEHYGNYTSTVLPRRYNAFLYIDADHALQPIHEIHSRHDGEVPETYPSGM